MPTISQLPAASAVNSGDLFVIVQSGTTKKATDSLVLASIQDNIQITEAQVTNLTTDLAAKLVKADNLSDLTNAATARTNLGLGSAAVVNVPISTLNGGTGASAPTAHTLPVAEGSSAFTFVGPLTNGQLLIGSTGADPVAAALTAGTNITINNSAGGIQISASGAGGFSWTEVTGTTQAIVGNNGYIANNGGLVTLTLPVTSNLGDEVAIVGQGAGGWLIAQNASQQIHLGSSATTAGVTGSLASTNQYDSLYMVCTNANLTWTVLGAPQGIITVA